MRISEWSSDVCASDLPLTMQAAVLPQLLGQMGRAKSYAERLFEFIAVGPLDDEAARDAIRLPIAREKESIENAALDAILAQTQGYPYFQIGSASCREIVCHSV